MYRARDRHIDVDPEIGIDTAMYANLPTDLRTPIS